MLTDDELWEKCKRGAPITSEDLGITPSDDNPFYMTEGVKYNDEQERVKAGRYRPF